MIVTEKNISLLRENGIRWVMLVTFNRHGWRVISVHRKRPEREHTWHHPVRIDCDHAEFLTRLDAIKEIA